MDFKPGITPMFSTGAKGAYSFGGKRSPCCGFSPGAASGCHCPGPIAGTYLHGLFDAPGVVDSLIHTLRPTQSGAMIGRPNVHMYFNDVSCFSFSLNYVFRYWNFRTDVLFLLFEMH